MGLDMYLMDEHNNELAYWRKANAIHRWFRDHCNYNDFDWTSAPAPATVTKQNLLDLVNLCRKIVNRYYSDQDKGESFADFCEETLPTESGFFFGDTTYDEWYVNKLRHTIEVLEPVIDDMDDDDVVYYDASW